VLFLQNHDQIGNRAFGERLTQLANPAALEAAIAAQMLCPQIPMLFMGEESASHTPFLFFTDHGPELAKSVLEGRRGEFASDPAFANSEGQQQIPDPNAPATFQHSIPRPDPAHAESRRELYHRLISIRLREIVPELDRTRSIDAQPLGSVAVMARWRLGSHGILTLATNLGTVPVAMPAQTGRRLFAIPDAAGGRAQTGELPGCSTVAFLGRAQ
jgi:1,4-alpha-glucan branching enzyme